MSNIQDEQNKLIQQYGDTVELAISLPRVYIEKLISEIQSDMLTLGSQPFDPDVEKINTIKLRATLAKQITYLLTLLDEEEVQESETPKAKTTRTTKRKGAVRKKSSAAVIVEES